MQAAHYAQYGDEQVLSHKEVASKIPNQTELLVEVKASSITKVDVSFLNGNPFMARLFTGLTKPKYHTLGSEYSGIVKSAPDGSNFKAGDAIFGPMDLGVDAHQNEILVPEASAIVNKPEDMSFEIAASFSYGGLTALPFLRDAGNIKAGDDVLIIGASGSVGLAAVQIAKIYGAHVSTVSSEKDMESLHELGADICFDRNGWQSANLQKYDIIFDISGHYKFRALKPHLKSGGVHLTPVLKPSNILAMITGNFTSKKLKFMATGLRDKQAQIKDLNWMLKHYENGDYKIIIDQTFDFSDIQSAFAYASNSGKFGEIVLFL